MGPDEQGSRDPVADYSWQRVVLGALLVLIVMGGLSFGYQMGVRLFSFWSAPGAFYGKLPGIVSASIPLSKLPGPPRTEEPSFVLDDANSQGMTGVDDPENERWCDIAGNFYSADFVRRFSYARPLNGRPVVRVRIQVRGATLAGRVEAQGLKPNFAYQLKLRGDYAARDNFETIGRLGRWRLPGHGTNYSDQDYENCAEKSRIEAYILFDFFVTDREGCAVRDFALDSSLHVIWNAGRQRAPDDENALVPAVVCAENPATYSVPKVRRSVEFLWAERETCRYRRGDESMRLPPGMYRARLALTEESFHATGNDGGHWGTVFEVPVQFEILAP
ncbi:MAG: hypothetical protein A3K19_21620 [Lentisphaerae bacterium RIFOXYB12_FULL_65_16]|nr:MAG: hypothetical protein A3K18_20870 [Lentisphaerae bacterium RIFOXYA12_64_32]OGV93867.1 MAG: hypothetical protein A3K19_21620 [Lentisphaerae bacterium RIFOXYB12_FULL_65_16]